MSRTKRATIGQDTVDIVERGSYQAVNGAHVDITQRVAECLRDTKTVTPSESDLTLTSLLPGKDRTDIDVTNETTLAVARRLVVDNGNQHVLCLNFASAKNPGGGFLGGSQAQEESLARSSALYASLLTQNDSYYEANRKCGTALYTDTMILSPHVPVFRNDEGTLFVDPYPLTILTSPAVNAGAIRKNEPDKVNRIRPTMATRIANVLSAAAHHGYEDLILGAWGCGVFQNDPGEVAELFAEALQQDARFCNRFSSVTFAVYDVTPDERIITPFRRVFEARS